MSISNIFPVNFGSIDELMEYFSVHGTKVGLRKGNNKRTQDDKEIYNLRQYLVTLGTNKLINYPISIHKSESPDFFILERGKNVGLEITEATTEAWQKELHHSEDCDTEPIQLLDGDGWVGDQLEQDACKSIIKAISKKAKKIGGGKYQSASGYDLLIYLNFPLVIHSTDLPIAMLRQNLIEDYSPAVSVFRTINIIAEPHLLLNIMGAIRIFDIPSV